MNTEINVIGAGFAGCESAWQIAKRGIKVNLFEMKPIKKSLAHNSENFAEIVCSNSFGSMGETIASSLLKRELQFFDSLIVQSALETKVPAGQALAVDRDLFSKLVTKKIEEHPLIQIHREEVTEIDADKITIIATGPLTSDGLTESILKITGEEYFHFFDAASPIIEFDSLNQDIVFKESRYGKGDTDYINCPMNKEEYEQFWNELVNAELAPLKDFDDYEKNKHFFENCLPIEVLAKRGIDTPRFGPMKPVGLTDPRTDRRPYAVVQLRQDNAVASLYNIVGFQTQLKWSEQKRIFRMIPGLENAEFARYGVMHRNTYINSPKLLNPTMQLRNYPNIFFAGLLTGVEGYMESSAMGALAGINASNLLQEKEFLTLPNITMMGALSQYVSNPAIEKNFQPINSNWGIIEALETNIRDKKLKNAMYVKRALDYFEKHLKNI